jgi:hypothetical protein
MRLTALAILLSGLSLADPITTCQGVGVYCDSGYPEFEGRLLENSNGAIGLISWLSPQAESDYTIYAGPVFVLDPSDFYVPGIYGEFSLWVDPPISGGSSENNYAAPEPATWILVGGAILLGVRRLVRQ